MARNIFTSTDQRVSVDAYVGPPRDDNGMRRRYQVAVISDQDGRHHTASLSYEEARRLSRQLVEEHWHE